MESGGDGMWLRHGRREGVVYMKETRSWCEFQCVCLFGNSGRGGGVLGEWGCNGPRCVV